jgi:membrane protease YdiL (CAAX protease family)
VGANWSAVALLTAPLLMVATLFALSLVSPTFVPGIFIADNKGSLLLVSLAVGLAAGTFEELGWTGFAVPTLRRRHSVLATGLIVGIWWSAWHLAPNVWSARAAAGDLAVSVHLTAMAVGIFVGYLTAFRVLMVWVHDRTQSLLGGMLMHVSLTTSLLILNPIGISGASLLVFSFAFAAAVWVVVGVVSVADHGRLRRRPPWRRAA